MSDKKTKQPWPTKVAMEQVYHLNLWGGKEHDFYSGEGSHHLDIVTPYIQTIVSFLDSFKNPISVCDLGCGDFNIGSQLVEYTQKYIGVDIVPDLIIRNQTLFKQDSLEFKCLDIAVDPLPKADCAIIRQVLQHLSNQEVLAVVRKLYQYKYIILTEHIPDGEFIPNKDIISGQGIRIKKKSGVNILTTPFDFKVIQKQVLTSVILDHHKGKIVTTLYQVF